MRRVLLEKNMTNSFPVNTISWLKNTYEDWDFAVFYEESFL